MDKKLVLLIEDDLNQLAIAKKVFSEDFKIIAATNLSDAEKLLNTFAKKIIGIVTDLHFPNGDWNKDKIPSAPLGLAIVAEAVNNNIPVVVCSDIDHHHSGYVKIIIKVLKQCPGYKYLDVPVIEDNKNWERAENYLIELINNERTEE